MKIPAKGKPKPLPAAAERARLIRKKPADYIEKTLPEDPTDRAGQKTRDDVTPEIPSNKRGRP